MANALYDKAREKYLAGALSWSNDNVKAMLVDLQDYTPNLATDEFLSAIPAAGRVATSANLTGKTTAAGVADADDAVFTAATGDQSELIVLFKDTGTVGTSPLIALVDTATGLPVLPNGGDISVAWDNGADRIFRL